MRAKTLESGGYCAILYSLARGPLRWPWIMEPAAPASNCDSRSTMAGAPCHPPTCWCFCPHSAASVQIGSRPTLELPPPLPRLLHTLPCPAPAGITMLPNLNIINLLPSMPLAPPQPRQLLAYTRLWESSGHTSFSSSSSHIT